MSITRRHFLLGTGAGLILPSLYDRIVNYIDRTGEPLLEHPKSSRELLVASSEFGDNDGWELNWGDPVTELPSMTVREFAERYSGYEDPVSWYLEGWVFDDEPVNWDAEMDPHWVMEFFCRADSPNARAYHYLSELDLGPDFQGPNAAGELRFIDGPVPGSNYLGVHACDLESISLLQARLNALNTGLYIEVQ